MTRRSPTSSTASSPKSGPSSAARSKPKASPRSAASSKTSSSAGDGAHNSAAAIDPPSIDDQVNQVLRWVLTGATIHDIHEAIRETWPAAEPSELLDQVQQQLGDEADCDADLLRGWCYAATRDLYRRMVEIGDFAGALRAVKLLSEL